MKMEDTARLDVFFAGLAKRLEIYLDRDPKKIKELFDKLDIEMKKRPKLKEILDIYGRLYYSGLKLADLLNDVYDSAKGNFDKSMIKQMVYARKIVYLKSSSLKNFKTIVGELKDDNKVLAKVLAYQEVLACGPVPDDKLNTIVQKLKISINSLKQQIEEIRKTVNQVYQEYKKREQELRSQLNINQEAFDAITNFIKNKLKSLVHLMYNIYRKISAVILTIDSYVSSYISKFGEKFLVKTGLANDPILYVIAMGSYAVISKAKVKDRIAKKINSTDTKNFVIHHIPHSDAVLNNPSVKDLAIKATGVVGVMATTLTIVKWVRFAANLQTNTYSQVKSITSTLASTLSGLSDVETSLEV